jgi:hypothetical protein
MRRLFSFLTLFVLLWAAPAAAQDSPPRVDEGKPITLKAPDQAVSATTESDTATEDEDFKAAEKQTLLVDPEFTVETELDERPERDETFIVRYTLVDTTTQDVKVTITDDDLPTVELVGAQPAAEDEPGAAFAVINPTPVDRPVSVAYSVASGTATAGSDFDGRSDRVTIPAGERGVLLGVPYVNDTEDEPDETFTVTIGDAQGATLTSGRTQGDGTIVNDDLRSLSIADGNAREGDGENVVTRVPVTLSAPTFRTVTVQYATLDGVARAPIDYLSRLGTLTFAPGQTQQFVDLAVVSDERKEGTELFGVLLGKEQGATIQRGAAVSRSRTTTRAQPGRHAARDADLEAQAEGPLGQRPRDLPAAETRCKGRLTLFTVADRKAKARSLRRERRLGRKSYTLAGGQGKTVKMTLSRTLVARPRRPGACGSGPSRSRATPRTTSTRPSARRR